MQHDYGSNVMLKGSVSGFRNLDADSQLNGISYPKGTAVYVIEFSDGSAVELPESLLSGDFDTTSNEIAP